jgi:hypothetical protein
MPSAAPPTAFATSLLVGSLDIDRQSPFATERPGTAGTASFAEAAIVKQADVSSSHFLFRAKEAGKKKAHRGAMGLISCL